MALPPTMMPPGASPPMGAAPIAQPTPSPGAEAAAMAKIQTAVKILQEAFSGLPPAGEPGKKVLKAIQQLSEIAPTNQAAPGVGAEALRGLAASAQKQAPLEALMRQMPPAGGAPPGGAEPPA